MLKLHLTALLSILLLLCPLKNAHALTVAGAVGWTLTTEKTKE